MKLITNIKGKLILQKQGYLQYINEGKEEIIR
jgi:hypothetical protein